MGRPPPPVVSPASLHMYMGPSLLRKCANESLCVAAAASARRWQSALDATTHLVAPQVRSRRPIGHGRSRVGVVSERCRRSALFAPNASVGAAVSVRQLRGLSRDTFGVPRALPWGTGSTPDESSPCGKVSRFGGLVEDGVRKSPAPKRSIQKRVEHPSGVGTCAEELLSVLSACYDGSVWTRSLG